jgi:beta-glucanase (GH16 family)
MSELTRRQAGKGLLSQLVWASAAAAAPPKWRPTEPRIWAPPGVDTKAAFFDDFAAGLRLRNCPGRNDSRTGYTDDNGAPDVKLRWLSATQTEEIGGYKYGTGVWTPREKWPNGAMGYSGGKSTFMIDPEYAGWQGQTPFSINADGNLELKLTVNNRRDLVPDRSFLGGLLSSRWFFSQLHGYFAARMRLPRGQGVFPAFWLLPHNPNPDNSYWPPEIDIVECTGERHEYFGSIHYKDATGQKSHISKVFPLPDIFDSWHEFGVLWTPEAVSFFCDGRLMGETQPQYDTNRSPMYMLVNLSAHDGSWGAPPSASSLPAILEVNWIGAWPLAT